MNSPSIEVDNNTPIEHPNPINKTQQTLPNMYSNISSFAGT